MCVFHTKLSNEKSLGFAVLVNQILFRQTIFLKQFERNLFQKVLTQSHPKTFHPQFHNFIESADYKCS